MSSLTFQFLIFCLCREKIHKKAMDLVIGAYELLHTAILDPQNAYADASSILIRTPDQVKTLLA